MIMLKYAEVTLTVSCVSVSEQQELSRQIQSCASDRLRQDLEREMEALMKRMENKGEQIAKVRRHQTQVTPACTSINMFTNSSS